MSISTFKIGKLSIGGNDVSDITNAALTISCDPADRTVIGNSWKRAAALAKSWSLQVTCKYDGVATAIAAIRTEYISGDCEISSVEMFMTGATTSQYFTGSAGVITGFNLTKSVNSDDQLQFTINGNGALAYT